MFFEAPKSQEIIPLYCLVIKVLEYVRQLREYVAKQALANSNANA
jgi:hypothetical protein